MDLSYYRQRLINIYKNIKNNGEYIQKDIIVQLEKFINYIYNKYYNNSFIKEKLDIVVKKYNYQIIKNKNQYVIQFPTIENRKNINWLYKSISDFLNKIEYLFSVGYKQIVNDGMILKKINNKLFDNITKSYLQSQKNNYENKNNIENLLNYIVQNNANGNNTPEINLNENYTVDDVLARSHTNTKKYDLMESNAKTLLDE